MSQENFREKSIKKLSSPERTDEYVRRAGVGRGIITGAAVLLAAAGIMWGIVHNIEESFLQRDAVEKEQIAAGQEI